MVQSPASTHRTRALLLLHWSTGWAHGRTLQAAQMMEVRGLIMLIVMHTLMPAIVLTLMPAILCVVAAIAARCCTA